MKKIAIYGKGGIGKSTVTSNLSAALSGHMRVMQIGCDPKADSTANLLGGRKIPTVLDMIKEKNDDVTLDDIVYEGYNGVLCVEAGGPTPGIGCAGLGIIAAFKKLEELSAFERYEPDIVLYDVLGDVVCGGFAMPMRAGYAEHVFIVTSGEMMALFAASNISRAIENFGERGYAKNGGFILNKRNVQNEIELVEQAAREAHTDVIAHISRSDDVQRAEALHRTVIEALPASPIASEYHTLAGTVLEICGLAQVKKAAANA